MYILPEVELKYSRTLMAIQDAVTFCCGTFIYKLRLFSIPKTSGVSLSRHTAMQSFEFIIQKLLNALGVKKW